MQQECQAAPEGSPTRRLSRTTFVTALPRHRRRVGRARVTDVVATASTPAAGVAGRVLSLHRYPLKSADGEQLHEVHIGPGGLDDDRRWALSAADGTLVTAKEAPSLRLARAASDAGRLVVEIGDSGPTAGSGALEALTVLAGTPVSVADAPGGHQQVAAVHLVSTGAVSAPDAPSGCDPVPRANIVLDLEPPGAERGWLGRRLALGEVELRVTRTPARCLGVYAEVLVPGVVRAGDPVELLGPPAAG